MWPDFLTTWSLVFFPPHWLLTTITSSVAFLGSSLVWNSCVGDVVIMSALILWSKASSPIPFSSGYSWPNELETLSSSVPLGLTVQCSWRHRQACQGSARMRFLLNEFSSLLMRKVFVVVPSQKSEIVSEWAQPDVLGLWHFHIYCIWDIYAPEKSSSSTWRIKSVLKLEVKRCKMVVPLELWLLLSPTTVRCYC